MDRQGHRMAERSNGIDRVAKRSEGKARQSQGKALKSTARAWRRTEVRWNSNAMHFIAMREEE